ncbi:MAG: hypothetical protein JW783_12995 [Bacteroidales bacterium]|nr:hypothetical protein [Bacteroidales bacterium]MBN2749332.1 hypothetical protein [Bacteroidales bacterium]
MDIKLKSKALEANLEQTSNVTITLPDTHRWFLSLSANQYGINQHTTEFIQELNHPYLNLEFLSEEVRKVALTDYWFYAKHPEAEKALSTIVDIMGELLSKSTKDPITDRLLLTIAAFAELIGKENKPYYQILQKCLTIYQHALTSHKLNMLQNASSIKKKLAFLASLPDIEQDYFTLLKTIANETAIYWERHSNVEQWLTKEKRHFPDDNILVPQKVGKDFYHELNRLISASNTWAEFNENVPFYSDIANYHRQQIEAFESPISQFHYLLYLLKLPTMEHLKDYLIWDLNKLLTSILNEIPNNQIEGFVNDIFALFEELQLTHKSIVLDCISTLGKEFARFFNKKLLNQFEEHVIRIGFTAPGDVYMSEDWQLKADPNHLKSIRVWLELVETAPKRFEKLLAALVVNLKLGGILIFDTDLFQRDVSKLLNAEIGSIYKPVKQLCRIFPVYFNQIGAEGELRDVSTALDTLSNRQDRLMHFLRKQIHIDSNNKHLGFLQTILQFWVDGNITPLAPLLPSDIREKVSANNEWVTPIRSVILQVSEKLNVEPTHTLNVKPEALKSAIDSIDNVASIHKQKFEHFYRIYHLLKEKYYADAVDIITEIKLYGCLSPDDLKQFNAAAEKGNKLQMVRFVYTCLGKLNKVVTDKKKSEGWENIYYKRHVAFGIPSMYGEYHEAKFEALGLIFKLEKAVSKLMKEAVAELNLSYITADTLVKTTELLMLFYQGLKLDGITNQGFESNLKMLKYSLSSRSFSLHQYINIFQFLSNNVKEIIRNTLYRRYDSALKQVIPFYLTQNEEQNPVISINKRTEEFYREMLSSAFLLQNLDTFITTILSSLNQMSAQYTPETISNIMSFDIDMMVSPLYKENINLDNRVFIGSKGFFLKQLYLNKLPVPPGFILTTEVFRQQHTILSHKPLKSDFESLVLRYIKELERLTGKEYGNPNNPLLLSVRSGTAISMPGAMNTFLNVGMNDTIAQALSMQPNMAWTAWDCYRRFLQSWGMSFGIERSAFDHVVAINQSKFGAEVRDLFNPDQMKRIALGFKKVLEGRDVPLHSDPTQQLFEAIKNVHSSWYSQRAQVYRKHLQIADEWGTAVIIQKMVLGNLHKSSGTGVVFTHDTSMANPGIRLNGDYSLLSQGEDVVGGTTNVLPISEHQTNGKKGSLQTVLPRIYQRLYQLSEELINKLNFGHQEIEFTFESDNPYDLYILQVRDQDIYTPELQTFYVKQPATTDLLGKGIGIGNQILNGVIVFDVDDLKQLKANNPDAKPVFVSADTTPDDIGIILECDGLVTSRGGATSHAAVTAGRLGKTCVLSCSRLQVSGTEKRCRFGEVSLHSGDKVSVDAATGSVYKGHFNVESSTGTA